MEEITKYTDARNDTIDALILSVVNADWTKIALIISKVFEAEGFADLGATGQNVADRLYILVDAGQLSVQGNMRRWRDSDVKLVK